MTRRVLIIAGIFFAVVLTAVVLLVTWAPSYLKKKITKAVNTTSGYNLHIDEIALGTASVRINGIDLRPKLDKKPYFKKLGFQTDWITAQVDRIQLDGIDWIELVFHERIIVKHAEITHAEVYVYRDKRLPHRKIYKPLPSTLLREMKIAFIIPELRIKNSRIVYEEIGLKSNVPLTVPFGTLDATFLHVSSDDRYLQTYPTMRIEASARIFDSVETKISYSANVHDSLDQFKMKGEVNAFSATLLNRIEPSTGLGIESGQIRFIRFNFTANEHVANGVMNMSYNGLKVSVAEEVKRNKLKTVIANIFIRNSSEVQPEKPTGKIHVKRNKDRFIFNYWWNSFRSGVISIMVKKPERMK